MTLTRPQQIPPELDPELFAAWQSAMQTLVRPAINQSLSPRIPKWIQSIDAITMAGDAQACLHAGLWLLADDLPQAHAICQDIPTSYGSAWHAHLHRREADFSNAKYWWRRASGLRWTAPGNPPLNDQILALLEDPPRELSGYTSELATRYDPARFVDLVQNYHQTAAAPALVAVQRLEWACLFLQCYALAAARHP
jgi:hypothetical protein